MVLTCWSTPQPPPMILLFRHHECCGEKLTSSSSALEHRSDGFVERDGTLELELVFRGAKLLLATASHLKT
jgi:hypothetical protein